MMNEKGPQRPFSIPEESPAVTRQARGEQRRDQILEATWRVVLRDGVRGVRHRAVAEAAGVPLAATTYYFKDIQDLLVQSFQRFAEVSLARFAVPFWSEAEVKLGARRAQMDREQVGEALLELATDYIEVRLAHHREQVVLEYAFWYAALQEPMLQLAVRDMMMRSMALMLPWLQAAGLQRPEQAARCLLATVRRIEYEALIEGSAARGRDDIRDALGYQIRGLW